MGPLIILLMNKLNVQLKMLANKINTAKLHPINKHLSNFYLKQMHYSYKLDENIFKRLIKKHTPY